MSDVDERLLRMAQQLPDGFAIRVATTITNQGVVEVRYVLFTGSPESGHLSRRIASVKDLDGPRMVPFDDAPWGAIQALTAIGWMIAK